MMGARTSGRLSILALFMVLGVFMSGAVSDCMVSDDGGLLESEVKTASVYQGIHWADDGEKLVFVRSDRLFVVDITGGGIRQISEITTRQDGDFDIDLAPNVSPDGTAIAYTTLRYRTGIDTDHSFEIATSDLDGGNIKRLTKNESLETNPVWSPDGTRIAFLSDRDQNWGVYRLYTMARDGSDVQSVAPNTRATGDPAVWSPDGKRLAFLSNLATESVEEYAQALYTVSVDGSNLTKVYEEVVEGGLRP